MKDTGTLRAKRNIAATLANQLVSTLCGILVPRVMIAAFGSAVYGATTSIAQFLSYISLLEGGIGRVARGALYPPLAKGDETGVSRVYHALRRFFGGVGLAFLGYTLVLSLTYHRIADVGELSRGYVFALVWAISLSSLAKYLWGLPNITLLNADQRQYVTNTVILATTIANVLLIALLTRMGCGVVTVKLGSSLIFVLRPLILSVYVRRHYALPKMPLEKKVLPQKWTGLGQHLAYTVHSNTDVMILTVCADLRLVSVYSVYHLIISSVRNIAASFSGGMEAVFGELIAKNEGEKLRQTCRDYQALLSVVSMVLFGTTGGLILPFVRLYTAGISDAEYIRPGFALALLLAEGVGCLALPWAALPIGANRLKQTKWGAYGEAALNLGLSLMLIRWDPLVGVALGTLISVIGKSVYDLHHCAKYILQQRFSRMLFEFLASVGAMALIGAGGMTLLNQVDITSFGHWALWAVGMTALAAVASLTVNRLLYPEAFRRVLAGLVGRFGRKP